MHKQIGMTIFTKDSDEGEAKTMGSRKFQVSWKRKAEVDLQELHGLDFNEEIAGALATEFMREMPMMVASILVDGIFIDAESEVKAKHKKAIIARLEPFMDKISKVRLLGKSTDCTDKDQECCCGTQEKV